MLIHTAVVSLTPLLHQHRGAPPDMLSGGGRQILASYTEFRYQGNFSDITGRLIDTLPHQSPAIGVSESLCGVFRSVLFFLFCVYAYHIPAGSCVSC